MNALKKAICLTVASAAMAFCGPTFGDNAACTVISSGSAHDTATGSAQVAGLACIGASSNGTISLRAGVSRCFDAGISCLLGDVNHDGLIDGEDINSYVRVKITNSGTAYEFCASNLTPQEFTTLLLSQ